MSSRKPIRVPVFYRALVALACWITPQQSRPEWRERWDANLWSWWVLFDRGELTLRDRADLFRYGLRSLRDAFWLRVSRQHLRHSMRGPLPVASVAALLLLALAGVTHGFRGTRSLFAPLPVEDPDSLVSVRYRGAADEPQGSPPRLVPLWRDQTALLSGLAGYYRPLRSTRAYVTYNFFFVIGVRPVIGRVFGKGETSAAVLSSAAWSSMFSRDPGVIGRSIDVRGESFSIVGVLPENFWAIAPGIEVWTPLELEPPGSGVPFLIGALGRLRDGVSREAVRTELFQIARDAHLSLPRRPLVDAFDRIPASPLKPYLFTTLFALMCGTMLVAQGLPTPPMHGFRSWAYLVWKLAAAVALPTLIWVEATRIPWGLKLPEPLMSALVVVLPALVYIGLCAFAIWWSFADQRRRCPVCLQVLSMAVTIGSWSSVLDPAQTETFCDSGHGLLCQPETIDGPPERWTDLDASWGELFGHRPEK